MQKQLIECVPNISEGRDIKKINQIANIVETVDGIKLLDIDPGAATNRTVITFVGEPKQVIKAAFLLIKKAAELIDMSKHTGEHPRFGATDVCPLVPISGITLEETAKYAEMLGKAVGDELGIPVYLYESAASKLKTIVKRIYITVNTVNKNKTSTILKIEKLIVPKITTDKAAKK